MSRLLKALRDAVLDPLVLVELFVLSNLAFLAVDVYVAHSINEFAHPAEWIPVAFSLLSPAALVVAMVFGRAVHPPLACGASHPRRADDPGKSLARFLGMLTGWGAVLVGVAGLIWHLESSFFDAQTIENLVYAAPFAAPLAYTGLGLVLLLNRTLPSDSADWARWIVLLALGGFVGNFALSLADHAQNGFFNQNEWIAVAAAAFAVGALLAAVLDYDNRPYLWLCLLVMLAEIGVGLLGWYFHLRAIAVSPMDGIWQKVLYSAPIFAPLLFADLAALGMLGLWALVTKAR